MIQIVGHFWQIWDQGELLQWRQFYFFKIFLLLKLKYKKYTILTMRDTTKIKIKVIHTQEVITNQNKKKRQQK